MSSPTQPSRGHDQRHALFWRTCPVRDVGDVFYDLLLDDMDGFRVVSRQLGVVFHFDVEGVLLCREGLTTADATKGG